MGVASRRAVSEPAAPLFVYVHLPKAGGTSMREALDALFGRARVFWHARDGWIQRLAEAGAPAFAPYAVVGGHFPGVYVTPQMAGRPVMIVALVREPIARLVSHYAFFKRHPGNRPVVGDLTLLQALQPGAEFATIVHAIQPRMLTGRTNGLRAFAELRERPHLVADVAHAQAVFDRMAAIAGLAHTVPVGRANIGEAGYASAFEAPGVQAAVRQATRQDRIFYRELLALGGLSERLAEPAAAPAPAA